MRNSIVKVILTMSVTDVLLLGLNGEIEIVVLQHIEVSELGSSPTALQSDNLGLFSDNLYVADVLPQPTTGGGLQYS